MTDPRMSSDSRYEAELYAAGPVMWCALAALVLGMVIFLAVQLSLVALGFHNYGTTVAIASAAIGLMLAFYGLRKWGRRRRYGIAVSDAGIEITRNEQSLFASAWRDIRKVRLGWDARGIVQIKLYARRAVEVRSMAFDRRQDSHVLQQCVTDIKRRLGIDRPSEQHARSTDGFTNYPNPLYQPNAVHSIDR